jgi:hypothetical protein
MSDLDALELSAAEYVLGLEALGLGFEAMQIQARFMARDIRPLLLRQRELLDASLVDDPPNFDAQVSALDLELASAWGRCLEALKILWLTKAPQIEEEAA